MSRSSTHRSQTDIVGFFVSAPSYNQGAEHPPTDCYRSLIKPRDIYSLLDAKICEYVEMRALLLKQVSPSELQKRDSVVWSLLAS